MKNPNRLLRPSEVAARLAERPGLLQHARQVGRWILVEFDAIPEPEVRTFLHDLGFHWNKKRKVWQHPCGRFSKASPRDPRWKYGSYPLAATQEEEAA